MHLVTCRLHERLLLSVANISRCSSLVFPIFILNRLVYDCELKDQKHDIRSQKHQTSNPTWSKKDDRSKT